MYLINIFVPAFVTLFVIIDPIGLVPIFIALTQGSNHAHKRRMARNGVVIAIFILLVFALFGKTLLGALGISLAAFRIAGGVLLFLIALEMIFERRNKKRSGRVEQRQDELAHSQDSVEHEGEDIAAFPMAMPFLAGPGAIASIMLLMGEHQGVWMAQAMVILAMLTVLTIALTLFLLSSVAASFLAPSITTVITRLLGMLLAALSVQFIIDGIKQSFSV